MKNLFYLALLLFSNSLFSQDILKLEEIMKGNEFVGNQPSNPSWSWDSKRIFFEWNPSNEPGNSIYFWEKGMKNPQILPDTEYNSTLIADISQNSNKIRYYLKNGALFSFNTSTKKHEKIIQNSKYISNLKVLNSGESVYFQQEGNLFLLKPTNSSLIQLTNFKSGNNTENEVEKTYLENQQAELFDYIQSQNKKESWYKEKNSKTKEKFPKAYFYGKNSLENIQISPDEKHVLFRLSSYPIDLETHVENHITESGYTQEIKAREKVSIHALSDHKLFIFNLEKDSIYEVSFSNLTDIRKNPVYLSLYPNFESESKEDRKIAMHEAIFNKNATICVIDVRSLDNKDRWIVRLDIKTGKIEELEHQHDAAWIGGPGISEYNFEKGTLGFLKDEETIYFQSEESGFSHLYSLNVNTKKKVQLTTGKWEVREIIFSQNKEAFYITANKLHAGNREFYKLNLKTNVLEEILIENGAHEVQISPDEKSLAFLFSTKNKPWELYFSENKIKATKTQLTSSTTKEFNSYIWRNPEVITFTANDKTSVNARIYEADKSKKNGAAVIFVHGAGYLQNAHNYWSYYLREFMFHNLLADKGYTILDIDYRGSDGYGRDVRTGIYRHMGGLDLSDNLDGRKLLIEKYGIDSSRIGIYGGSYGGFITLMGLLTEPGKFKCGAALRSVTDWAHYNGEYTSNILNFPETDPEAYRRSSPIYFADNLKDKLLMLHGMIDDNVQFQDITRISQRFIELGKQNWELAVFPVEAHGFKETSSWIDEYRRILNLFETNLNTK
ncbi:MAG: prolyl oligopeptidase family serine peptidase [Bacteroidota bacterium]